MSFLEPLSRYGICGVLLLEFALLVSTSHLENIDNFPPIFPKDDIETTPSGSCLGKCGMPQGLPCSCSSTCVVYKNCCEDFEELCPEEILTGLYLYQDYLSVEVECLHQYFTISSCGLENIWNTDSSRIPQVDTLNITNDARSGFHPPGGKSLHNTTENLLKMIRDVPITDETTGLVYRTKDIFNCFASNESKPRLWNTRIELNKFGAIRIFDELSNLLDRDKEPIYTPPTNAVIGHGLCLTNSQETKLIETCDLSKIHTEEGLKHGLSWKNKCNNFTSYVVLDKIKYKNKYCAYCTFSRTIDTKPFTGIDVKNDHSFSVSVSIVNNAELNLAYNYVDTTGSRHGPWTEISCQLGQSKRSNVCNISKCNVGFTLRPSGICCKFQELMFILPEDEYQITKCQFQRFHSFLKCRMASMFDFPTKSVNRKKDTENLLVSNSNTNENLWVFSFYHYIDDTWKFEYPSNLYFEVFFKLMSAAKDFKHYRKQQFDAHPELIRESANGGLETITLDWPKNIKPGVEELADSLSMMDRGKLLDWYNTTVCFCSTYIKLSCYMNCMTDGVYEKELVHFGNLSSDKCFSAFMDHSEASQCNRGDSLLDRSHFLKVILLFTLVLLMKIK